MGANSRLGAYSNKYGIHLLNFFPNSIHGFGLVWKEKLFEGDMISDRGEVFTK